MTTLQYRPLMGESQRYCVENARQLLVDYELVELGMFGSYDNSFDSNSDSDTILPYFFQDKCNH